MNRRDFMQLLGSSAVSTKALNMLMPGFEPFENDEGPDEVSSENSYLTSIYAPIPGEDSFENLEIEGTLPSDIEGTYFRNGPNPVYAAHPHHWFDGDGMIHSIRISDGKAHYLNRFIKTRAFLEEKRAGKRVYPGLHETFTRKFPAFLAEFFSDHLPSADRSHTDIIYFRDKLVSLFWLSGVPYQLNPQTLETEGPLTLEGYERRHISAHARIDPRTGELFFLDFSKLSWSPWVNVSCVSADGELKWDQRFPLPHNRLFHDVLITENYVVLMDFPVGFHLAKLKFDLFEKSESRIVLIPRSDPSSYSEFFMPAERACYVLHGMNAFEQEGSVYLTVCKYITNPFAKTLTDQRGETVPFVGELRVETRPTLWKLNLLTKEWTEEFQFEENTEFPRVNDKWLGRTGSRYSYHPVIDPAKTIRFRKLIKYDWKEQKASTLEFLPKQGERFCEEFVFIPKTQSLTDVEDDGYLASMIHTVESNLQITSAFEIYDAASLEFVASIKIPRRVPAGFHCKWIPQGRSFS